MEKKSFREVYEKIEVPTDGVLDAIKAGKERASHVGSKNKKGAKKNGLVNSCGCCNYIYFFQFHFSVHFSRNGRSSNY